jgi:N-formylglutamate amidohydrolase
MSEDCFVDELFSSATRFGAPLLAANFPRAYLDVNREPFELDPAMFHEPLPDYANTTSQRVAGGLGTIARVVSETDEIYRTTFSFAEAKARIDNLHFPYHAQLKTLLDATHSAFDTVLLIDCHSMPSAMRTNGYQNRPDIILGDRCGYSCAPQITGFLERFFQDLNFSVTRNQPYAGGFITEQYGDPQANRHAIQIEINRALYLDEKTLAKHGGFDRLLKIIEMLLGKLKAQWQSLLLPAQAAAAE